MRLIDSHAHLDFRQFNDDRDAVIEQAREAGLIAIVNVGTNSSSSRAAVALAEQYDFIYATVGVHPHDAKTVTAAVLDELRALARHPKVVAVGEIGLDYYVGLGQSADHSPRPVQRRAFADQLDLATELELPVVIHDREAHDDVMATLREWDHSPSVRETREGLGVFHTYSAGSERLEKVLEMGFFVGLSGPVTFPKANALRAVAAAVPLERLLVETDCPYLTPKPYRGRRNQPAYVRYVVEAVAQARGMSVETVAQATADNARRLFGIL
ncbi:MAG: TatD family hydrolase [Anaerolineae bacterium]